VLAQLLQVTGALAILSAFALSQAGRLETRSRSYLVLNLLGSAVLSAEAAVAHEFGFLLLEGSWAVLSMAGLTRLAARRR
jgi:hypothetical protein